MKFCEFCGKQLAEGEMCNCEDAKADRLVTGTGSSVSSQIDSMKESTFLALKGFFKDPVAAIRSQSILSISTSAILLAIEALAFGLLVWICRSSISRTASIASLFYGMLLNILNIGITFGFLYIFIRLFKAPSDTKRLCSVIAYASIPFSGAFLCAAILSLFVSGSAAPVIIFGMLMLFSFATSITLLNSGISPLLKDECSGMLAVSLSHGLGIPLYLFIVYKIIESRLAEMFYRFW